MIASGSDISAPAPMPWKARKPASMIIDVENVEIIPRDLYAINTVPVLAENFPWDRYSSVDVFLRYRDPANKINQNDLVRVVLDFKEVYEYNVFYLEEDKRTRLVIDVRGRAVPAEVVKPPFVEVQVRGS